MCVFAGPRFPIHFSNSQTRIRHRPYSLSRPRAGPSRLSPLAFRPKGDGAPCGATISPTPCGVAAPCEGTDRHAALHRGFSVPGAVLPWGATQANQPATGAASAARRRPSVQPSKAAGPGAGGRLAEASRPCGYEPQRRAPHPAPPSGSSLEDAPPSSRTQYDYDPIGLKSRGRLFDPLRMRWQVTSR